MCVLSVLDCFYKDFEEEKGYIGRTEAGDFIPYMAVKRTDYPKLILQYSIHAREYITTYLSLKQIEDFRKHGKKGTVYFIPAVNIDGIKKCLSGFPLYKANIRGVDLNVNFDAGWGKGKYNVFSKGSENYVGKEPFSERETRALRDFTLKIKPDMTVSYHSKGEEIYWEYNQEGEFRKKCFKLAESVANCTGYALKSTLDSHGGYKDWCVEKLKIPALTIEVGSDYLSHPIGVKNLEDIYIKNRCVIDTIIEEL